MRNIARLNEEIGKLEQAFGAEGVEWADDYSWIMVYDVRLPANIRPSSSDVLVFVPENYGQGTPYRDAFLTSGLERMTDRGWRPLEPQDHFFQEFPYGSRLVRFKKKLRKKRWAYLCLHQRGWRRENDMTVFLNQLYAYLSSLE